jgi:site-specific recombinase XerD
MKLLDLVDDYTNSLRGEGHRERGVESYAYTLRRFLRWLGDDADESALTTRNIRHYQAFMGSQRLDPGTIGNALTVIRSFCIFLIGEEMITIDPTTNIKRPKDPDDAPRALSHEQLVTLWAVIIGPNTGFEHLQWQQARNKRAMALMLLAGLRIAEASALLWRDVDLYNAELFVRDGKGGQARKVPINPDLQAILEQALDKQPDHAVAGRPDGQPMSPKSMAHLFERWLPHLCGLDITAHQLRHSFATELYRKGVHIRTIQYLLGHKQLETTMRYLMVDDDQKRDAVNRLKGWE